MTNIPDIPITLLSAALYVVMGVGLAVLLYRFRDYAFRGVPELSADGLAVFRAVFGVTLIYLLLGPLQPPDTTAPGGPVAEARLWQAWGWVEWLNENRDLRDAIIIMTLVALALFTVGLLARAAYAVGALGLVVMLLVDQEYLIISHVWAPWSLVLLALVVVPWGDAPGLETVVRARLGLAPSRRRPPGPQYGIALWLPGLVLGTVLAAAAFAKLRTSGFEWALGGAVRYHWVEDMASAPTSLGTWLAGRDPFPVLFSAAGLAFEGLFILHIFFRGPVVRMLAGLTVAGLLLGFYLFQGLFWEPWWLLLLVFLPWEQIARRVWRWIRRWRESQPVATAGRARGAGVHAAALGGVTAAILVQQGAISMAAVEQLPFFTNYPMYAWTHPSPEAFNERVAPSKFYRTTVRRLDDGAPRDVTEQAYRTDMLPIFNAIVALRHDEASLWQPSEIRSKLAYSLRRYDVRYGTPPRRVEVVVQRRIFDFDRGRLRSVGDYPPLVVDLEAVIRHGPLAGVNGARA